MAAERAARLGGRRWRADRSAAERRIAATKEQALAEVRGIAVDVGRSVVEKLTGVCAGCGEGWRRRSTAACRDARS